jgi:putative phage-type endonuclease
MEQGSPEWHQVRIGKVTASRVHDIIAKTKTGVSASRANYLAELVAERLTGAREESFTNSAMQWGIDNEAAARASYAFLTDATVTEVAFVEHPHIAMCGASPDGLVDATGLIEIKCPGTAKHIATLRGASIDAKYNTQMQWQMACTGRDWCDFVSYDPRLPVELQLHVRRVERDSTFIDEVEREVVSFLGELNATISDLTKLYMREAA